MYKLTERNKDSNDISIGINESNAGQKLETTDKNDDPNEWKVHVRKDESCEIRFRLSWPWRKKYLRLRNKSTIDRETDAFLLEYPLAPEDALRDAHAKIDAANVAKKGRCSKKDFRCYVSQQTIKETPRYFFHQSLIYQERQQKHQTTKNQFSKKI